MYGYSDHSHRGEYAEDRHDHNDLSSDIDSERWSRERAIEETRHELYDAIRGVRADLDFSDIWAAITDVRERIAELERGR